MHEIGLDGPNTIKIMRTKFQQCDDNGARRYGVTQYSINPILPLTAATLISFIRHRRVEIQVFLNVEKKRKEKKNNFLSSLLPGCCLYTK